MNWGYLDRGINIKQHWHKPFFRTPSLFHCADTHASCYLEDPLRNGTCSLLLLVVRVRWWCICVLQPESEKNHTLTNYIITWPVIGWGVPKRGSVDRSLFLSLDTRGAECCMACRPQSMARHMTCLILTMDIKPRHRNLCHRISSCFSCCIIYNPKSRRRWKRKVVNNFILEKQNALYNCFLTGEKWSIMLHLPVKVLSQG